MIVATVEQKVAATTGPIISVGEFEPWAARRAIIVVGGITVRLDEVTAMNVHMASEAVSLARFSSCRCAMAFKPSGVQALPRPRKLALMESKIAPMAG